MGKSRQNRDPAKRAAKRKIWREQARAGMVPAPPAPGRMSRSQANHASSGKARKKAAHGERVMARDREQRGTTGTERAEG